jgi:hypothetical protein
MKKLISVRLSKLTLCQLAELEQELGTKQGETITLAIERLHVTITTSIKILHEQKDQMKNNRGINNESILKN